MEENRDVEIWVDGACEPNPGGTAYGAFVVKRAGEEIASWVAQVGSGPAMSSNVAEYKAVISALWWLLARPDQSGRVTIYSDSQLVVQQMRGNWRLRGGLYLGEASTARRLAAQFPASALTFQWIPREENFQADGLSRQALLQMPLG